MRRKGSFGAALAVLCVPAIACAAPDQAGSPPPAATRAAAAVQPQALAALEKMGRYLRGLKNFTVQGESTLELVTEDGQKLQFPGTVQYKVRAPNGLQLDIRSDRKERQLFYDGKTLTVYGPRNKYYASVEAPPTIAELLSNAADRYGIELPLADLFLWGTDKAPVSALTSAVFVGPARIDGTVTEHYAFRQPGVDWQVWIENGARPLPRRLVITTTDDAAQPQYASTLKWNTDAKLGDSAFTFTPPKDAHRIELVEVDVVAIEEKSP